MKHNYRSLRVLLLLIFSSNMAFAQYTVSGTVSDGATGDPLPGVNIIIEGTSTGTITDLDGNYNLEVENGNITLVFSSIGYITEEAVVGPSTNTVNMTMQQDITNLEEVVVTGLATSAKRSNLANAVSTVSAKELTGTTTPQTLDGALYGKLTGANIVSNSGAPGGGISMRLRGVTTINGTSEPLYIVDGVYVSNAAVSPGTNNATQARTNGEVADEQDNPPNRIADLDPEDIENIEILKGASAAAIYGARANAGVVLITTKRGKEGKTIIRFSQDVGVTSILNPLGQRDYDEEIAESLGQLENFIAARNEGRLIDYEDALYGNNGFLTNSRVSITGGDEKTNFYIGGSWKDEEGIVDGTGFERKSIRANLDHKISEVFDIGISTNYVNSETQRGITNNDNAGVSLGISLVNTFPWAELFPDENGNYPNNPFASSNFLETRDLSTIKEETDRIIIGAKLNVNILKTSSSLFKLVLNGGLDSYTTETFVHFPEVLQWQQSGVSATNGFYSEGDNVFFNLNTSAFLVFNTNVGGWNLVSQLGGTRLDFQQDRTTTQATQLIGGQTNLEQAGAINVFNRKIETEDIGYFFQQEANWEDKVIGTAGVRLDKSSLNGDPDEIFTYPKFSLAGNIHNFSFFDIPAVSQLKIRAAYGEAGGVPEPDAVDLQQPAFTVFNGTTIEGNAGSIIDNTRGNNEIKPERSKEFEAGFDLGLFNNRVSLEATYYNRTVEDLILRAEVPSSSGFEFTNINGGELENEGVELGLGFTPINNSAIQWNSRANFWLNRSEIVSLDVPAFDAPNGGFASFLGIFRIQEGSSATQIVGPTPESTEAGIGDVKLGDAEPDFQLSWYNSISFLKNFEFSMLWHWKEGGDNINLTNLLADFAGTTHDFDDDDDGDGIVNGTERVNAFINGNNAAVFVEDASYLKLREIALYYNLPKALLTSTFGDVVESIRVGVSGNNVLLFSDYNSYDPEVSNFGSNSISTGVEVAPFPSSKRLFFHLSVGF